MPPAPFQAQTTVTGVITKTTFMEKTGAFWVIQVRDLADPQHSFTAIGNVPELKDQHAYRFEGFWQDHATYGRQFKVVDACPTVPRDRQMLINYLAWGSIPGIKGGLAEKIVDHFGEATLEVLTHTPMRLKEIDGIGTKKCHKIMTALAEHEGFNENELFMAGLGLTRKMVTKIIKRYGDSSQKVVEETPYRLYRDISGVGFARADDIAQKVGYPPDGIQRIEAAILYLITSATDDGHCYATTAQLAEKLPGTVQLPDELLAKLVPEALTNLEGFGRLAQDKVAEGIGWFLPDLFWAEQDITAILAERMPPEGGEPPALDEFARRKVGELMKDLSPGQQEAVLRCVAGEVAIITGGPGVGKTTTANAVIHSLKTLGYTVALAAPTGRAAQRLSATSGLEAKTIHRLLEWNPTEGGFTRNKDNPLACTALLVDEASMIDIRLATALLGALPKGCKLIFLGDADQLPPIGPGNFLADMIASQRVPCSLLTEIFRQAKDSHIIMAAHHINRGQLPKFDNATDCKFIEVADGPTALATICRLIAEILPAKTDYDPVKDIQVLSPMNKGPLGTEAINTALKAKLQAAGFVPETLGQKAAADAPEYARLGLGDKVIQMTNNYELQVYNGDIGYVVGAEGKDKTTTIQFGDRLVPYDQNTVSQLRLAYGISIHKSQGSEFPVVVMPVARSHSRMLDRNLVYTGLTRAKKLVILVGERPTLAASVRKQHSRTRQTTLRARLEALASPSKGAVPSTGAAKSEATPTESTP